MWVINTSTYEINSVYHRRYPGNRMGDRILRLFSRGHHSRTFSHRRHCGNSWADPWRYRCLKYCRKFRPAGCRLRMSLVCKHYEFIPRLNLFGHGPAGLIVLT